MEGFYGKCGCDCLHCPTYKENIRTAEEKQRCSAGWKKYLNISLSPEKLRACDGCSVPEAERNVFYLNCKIRKCAMMNEIENCAYCKAFPCEELRKVHSLEEVTKREDYIQQKGIEISEEDYRRFIEPYAGMMHLKRIRENLPETKIKEYKKFSSKANFEVFNERNPEKSLKRIYDLLTRLGIEKDIPYAQLLTVENEREQLLKIVWIMGLNGIISNNSIETGCNTYMTQKIPGMYYKSMIGYADELKKHDVLLEIVPLVKKGWLTPTGGLRKEGWVLRMKFGPSYEPDTAKIFQGYIKKLHQIYKDKAVKHFAMVDMNLVESI